MQIEEMWEIKEKVVEQGPNGRREKMAVIMLNMKETETAKVYEEN